MSHKILLVDDEQNLLQGLRRQLHGHFAISLAEGGAVALEICSREGPFAVVVSDMRMPAMNGIQFLQQMKTLYPNTIRVMLTGNADQQTAIDAVNAGAIFRFLNKPCTTETLLQTLRTAVSQYELVLAEQELIQKTLTGSVKVLTDVLSLASPTAFGRSTRIRPLVRKLIVALNVASSWEIELATMLGQIGCVSMDVDALKRAYTGAKLTEQELSEFEQHPARGRDLIANIHRLAGVALCVLYQLKNYDGTGSPDDDVRGDRIPLGARILRVVNDYDSWNEVGLQPRDRIVQMRARTGRYDSNVLDALEKVIEPVEGSNSRFVSIRELKPGMTLIDNVESDSGAILVGKGQVVNDSIQMRLRSFSRTTVVREPLHVMLPVPT